MDNVIDFARAKAKLKQVESAKPTLHVSHQTGKITGDKNRTDSQDGMARIRASLEKINRLMSELKQMSVNNVNDPENRR